MAVKNAMFIFEVVVEKVNSLVESRFLRIRSDFADIFSLELKDPKQMYIVIPEPPPLPPEPPGKKKKKAKPKKPKKGKKGKVPEPPPEPAIQSGQSVLFSSTAEFLIQNMKKYPLEVSLWNKEDNLTFIGSNLIPWDPVFIIYLENIAHMNEPPPVILKDEYNIFEEGKAKLMAKISLQVKLQHLGEVVTTAFRTLSEDPTSKKCLYTGINSKTTSYVCTMKTTDEIFEENCNKIENKFIEDNTVELVTQKNPTNIVYADYKNAPGANLTMFKDGDYCCMSLADKPPDSIYKSPVTCPDIDHIVDYVRKIIVSCNDNMRMLTPRPTIRPRVKATDIDKYCYCKETDWPDGAFAEKFRQEAQANPCPMCIDSGKRPKNNRPYTFDIAHIRGPCGRADCRIARDMRAYIENLVEEDNEEFNINEMIGPCGSKSCVLADKIQQFIMHEGEFKEGDTEPGLSTQCNCVDKMKLALTAKKSCVSECSKECDDSDSQVSKCEGKGCPFNKPEVVTKVYQTYYFTVEHDFASSKPISPATSSSGTSKKSIKYPHFPPSCPSVKFTEKTATCSQSACTTLSITDDKNISNKLCPAVECTDYLPSSADSSRVINFDDIHNPSCVKTCSVDDRCLFNRPEGLKIYQTYYFTVEHDVASSKPSSPTGTSSPVASEKSTKYPHCPPSCPSVKFSEKTATCSQSACTTLTTDDKIISNKLQCPDVECPDYPPSPADSNIVINFDDIHNPCCVKTCDVADRIKDFIVESIKSQTKKKAPEDNPCYCDCVCTFKFSNRTTYCAVCGGYECLGDDIKDEPEYIKPHPCPVYHKLYDKNTIKTKSPWPEEEKIEAIPVSKPGKQGHGETRRLTTSRSNNKTIERRKSELKQTKDKDDEKAKIAKLAKISVKSPKKKVGKFTANVDKQPASPAQASTPPPSDKFGAEPEKKSKPAKADHHYPPVPKHMGWNWLAEDIPGMKPRPKWKPGAANKILVRKYKTVREGIDTIAKKKRALMNRKKKIEFKPTIVVQKKDGEYTVQMEVFKKYSKERLVFQNPYDDKPPLVYTIGKTPAEKLAMQKRRERRERRETRRKSRLLQSTFRDKCQEICLKAYNQAIGLLPLPNPNDPECPCYTNPNPPMSPQIDSCSCSDEYSESTSDTDNDEWIIEFTPPAARYDPKAKHPPVLSDNESQYTYLDYKVKCLDKSGNQVPRYFEGPDGKKECSDLGGFWGPGHVWMEINKDGYIGPDNRWIPMSFLGPDGVLYGAEEGFFTDSSGKVLTLGVDGYIDKDGKWAWYKKKPAGVKSTATASTNKAKAGTVTGKPGTGSPTSKKGKDSPQPSPSVKGKDATKAGDKLKVHKSVSHSTGKPKNPLIMSVSMNYERSKLPNYSQFNRLNVDPKKMAKYREIMKGLQMYEDFYELKPPPKANRASNTPRYRRTPQSYSPNVMQVPSFSRYGYGRPYFDSITDSSSQCLSPLVS